MKAENVKIRMFHACRTKTTKTENTKILEDVFVGDILQLIIKHPFPAKLRIFVPVRIIT